MAFLWESRLPCCRYVYVSFDISREGAVYKSRYPPEKHTRIEDIPITYPLNEYLLGKYTTPPPAWVANRSPIIT